MLSIQEVNDLLIMGEYQVNQMGKMIVIYYGSVATVLGNRSKKVWERQLRVILRHEFTHHVEFLAGDHDLERWDRKQLEKCKRREELKNE